MKTGLKNNAAPTQNTAAGLLRQYTEIVADLQRCADLNPANDLDMERSDQRESDLLDIEANLLDQAATIPLRSKDDIQALMDLWAKVSAVESAVGTGIDISSSDRIVMNIFRHMNDGKFSKD